MALENYRDISTSPNDINAGFQFEFHCARCKQSWRSPFRPYRMGQLSGWMANLGFLFSSLRMAGRGSTVLSTSGARGAKESALQEARELASQRYVACTSCRQGVCLDCFDNRAGVCVDCAGGAGAGMSRDAASAHGSQRSAGAAGCPSCGTPADGGRFCSECGFDMASTHKSCPGCGVMLDRQKRFCTDCGHAF